ncbi:MAG: DUF1648 domain-containing protein [Saprospiraceae bacterium]|nr:DUF1648 domain-containing protein [Saprospiraceae bacterium]
MKANKPVIAIEPDMSDRLMDALAYGALSLLFLLPLSRFAELPETIPIHFNGSGEADGFGSRYLIWMFPVLGGLMFLVFTYMLWNPHKLNYSRPVTLENAEAIYQIGSRILRFLRLTISVLLAYLAFVVISTATGAQSGTGKWFLPVLLVGLYVPLGYWVFRLFRVK